MSTKTLKGSDKSINTTKFSKTAKGYLSHLSLIFSNAKDLVTNFNCTVCSKTGVILFICIKWGKESMNSLNYQYEIIVTDSRKNHMKKGTKGWEQSKNKKRDCLLLGRLFSFKRSVKNTEDIGAYFIGIVKTSTKGFF